MGNDMTKVHATGFSQEWDERYAENTHLSIWPWSDLVSIVCRHAKPHDNFKNVLELGCGAGANIPFFLSRGDNYHAIEGSITIVQQLKKRFPSIADKIVQGDFTKEITFDCAFDMIVDRASLTHNDTESIKRCLDLVAHHTRPGGLYIGIDWFSKEDDSAECGELVDEFTRSDINSRHFMGVGKVHFSDQAHIENLCNSAGFEVKVLEHKLVTQTIAEDRSVIGTYSFVAVRQN